jgi:class 3 adenylate cyclase/streptogramin lyase
VAELPSGTVSLLFTDIEGSTRLQHRLGEDYPNVVAGHRRLLEEVFAAHGGVVVDRQTESFFVVFPRARHAVQAAAAAQAALATHAWPDGVQVKVRMGIHSGDPELAGDRYVGLGVARAARICASAHGGQVLLSSSARALLSDHERTALRTLGYHRLKDFAEPELISQLVVEGLPSQFPPLRTEPSRPRRRRLVAAVAALVLVTATAAAVVLLANGGSSRVRVGPTSLAVIDPSSNKVMHTIDVGFKSSLIAAGEGYVWLVDPTGSTLWKIDPRSRQIVSRIGIAVGAGAIPFGLAVGEGGVWVAVQNGIRQVVLEFGPDVGDLRKTIPYGSRAESPLLSRLHPLTIGEGFVWAIDSAAGGIWRIDPRTGGRRRLAEGLDALSVAAGKGSVWVAGSSSITQLDPNTGQELGSASTGSSALTETASVAVGANAVWFTTSSSRNLAELDPQSAATTNTFSVGGGPSGIAVGEGAVWVSNSRDGTVTRIDPRSHDTKAIVIGSSPEGVVAAYGAVWTSPGAPRS